MNADWISQRAGVRIERKLVPAGAGLVGLAQTFCGDGMRLLLVHITFAVATYLTWGFLALASVQRFRGTLPGSFSRRHRRVGWMVLGGLAFTALSATGMYVLVFMV